MQTDLIINKADIREFKFIKLEPEDLADGQVRLVLDSFAFTANNITYAATGHSFKYWQFFPSQEGWGKLPVWGFASIAESKHAELKVGERIYGYFPLATELVVTASKVSKGGFYDAAEHRQDLNPVYNSYVRTHASEGFSVEHNHLNALLRPMFMTSFMIDDQLEDNAFFEAEDIIMSSASSKTALGTAFLLKKNRAERKPYKLIALTSKGNKSFVESLNYYDQVLTYDELAKLESDRRAAYIDFAGNAQLRKDIHNHYADKLKHSSMIGLAHWQQAGKREALPGVKPSFFFAPAQIQKRMKDWGREGYQSKLNEAWLGFIETAATWLDVTEGQGEAAISQVYTAMLNNSADPKKGYILSF